MKFTEAAGTILSEKVLPKRHKKVVQYRLVNLDSIDPRSKLPVMPVTETFFGEYTFNDIGEPDVYKRSKVIKNVVSKERQKDQYGKDFFTDKIEQVAFENGYITVNTDTQPDLYVWLELHPNNGSNKRRPSTEPIRFIRTDANEKSSVEKTADILLVAEAITIANRLSYDQVKQYCASLALSGSAMITFEGRQSGDVRHDIMEFAKNNPRKFLDCNPDIKVRIRLNVTDAKTLIKIEHDEENRSFKFIGEKKAFFTYNLGEHGDDALVEYLSGEKGEKDLDKLQKALLPEDED